MCDRELDDTIAYLAPLAKVVSRRIEYRARFQEGELYTQALIGAWEAALHYDSEKHSSLWGYAHRIIKGRTWDQVRVEVGRDFSKKNRFQAVDPEEMRFIADDEHGYDNIDTRDMVGTLFERLSPQDRHVLMSLYLNDTPLKSVGEAVEISESRMCQIATKTRERAKRVLCEMCEGMHPVPPMKNSTLTSGGVLATLTGLED